MPELPEVETTRRGIAPFLAGRRVLGVEVREPRLRWPVAPEIGTLLPGATIDSVARRAKYLLVATARGSALLHLGMSGVLRVVQAGTPTARHDHVDWRLDSGLLLRFSDPRRFGCMLWQAPGAIHPLLAGLGPEPLSAAFDGGVLWQAACGRRAPIKALLMDARVVVGVGNIYASEALFAAGIDPCRAASRISRERLARLAQAVKDVLARAIAAGGTSMRDFLHPDGRPGYFLQELMVYGRVGEPCRRCGTAIRSAVIGQRSTFWCPRCQR